MLCKSGKEKPHYLRIVVLMAFLVAGPARGAQAEALATLAHRCAPDMSPHTVALMVRRESAGVPWAIHVNGPYRLPRPPASTAEAMATARWLAGHGYDFDLGLLQVNSRNAARFGLAPARMLEPCLNLHVASSILHECYLAALPHFPDTQERLRHALSCYNTGNGERGLRNGYVAGLLTLAARQASVPETLMIPTLEAPPATDASPSTPTPPPPAPSDGPQDSPRGQDAFTHAPDDVFTPRPDAPQPVR
ncbi:lytic transglycosylase domain-containing protein [Komagataeibacter sp. FNDCR2]|uniref:lytic transglycosylase domain-containing protein n=1 Tax=Komagataeibacter sp. FNDCR2 TaxID=2878682 RepID=UPI001E582C2E|nr:lytic transglycosylase domain-containing protein [Komagataeibacter sp. FNDCR2]MCE2575590.1 lytic transglycosylase domain-containing protein [Komagataeibacter sp. FNDCR2]